MLNYFNFERFDKEHVLVTNDFGRYAFLTNSEFESLLLDHQYRSDKNQAIDQSLDEKLRAGFFRINSADELLSDDLTGFLRDMKGYLFSPTALHIFVLTNVCNMCCRYCQATDPKSGKGGFMSPETGRRAVDIALQCPSKGLTFEFQGGEPLLNFDTAKEIILYTEQHKGDRDIRYTMVSNLIALTDEKLEFLKKYNVNVSTSLDGHKELHDWNRIVRNGESSYLFAEKGLQRLQEAGISGGAIETTTRRSLHSSKDIVNTYLAHDMHQVFLRPLTPLGMAAADWYELGYTVSEYLQFYQEALEYILYLNEQGIEFQELFATYFLKKILGNYAENYMELRSPCGGSIGQLAYYYDGNIYTCDEGRMVSESGDQSFCLGNVYSSSYTDLINTPVCKTIVSSSVIECLPGCESCVFQPYCGVCPIVTYKLEKNIIPREPHGYRCSLHYGILKILFEKIFENNPKTMKTFKRWIEGSE